MNTLKIKTKAMSFPDYKSVDLSGQLPKFPFDCDKYEKDLKRIQYANGKKTDVETVEKGDLVLLSCKSEHPHFQKNDIYLIVGKNLYSAKLEEKLIGLTKGKKELTIEEKPVSVHIKSIVRTTVPDLTDENVKTWNIEGVSTVEELKRYYFNRQVDAFRDDDEDADMVVTFLCNEILENGSFEYNEEEYRMVERTVEAQVEKARNYRRELKDAGEEPDGNWDVDTIAEMMIGQTLKAAAIGYSLLEEKGSLLTGEDYQKELRNRAELMHMTAEELAKSYSETNYAIEYYAQYFFDMLDNYVGEYMKKYYYENRKESELYDVAIVGAGPAGLSAALTLNVHNKKIIWFGTESLSDKVERSEKIANYAGVEMISGKELNEKFLSQIRSAGLVLTDKTVTQIAEEKNGYTILGGNEIYKAKTVLLTVGSVPAKGIVNEQELLGHGVSYCATCDGFLYKGKTIAVFCGSERFEHEVEYLAQLAEKVYLYAAYENSKIDLPNVEILEKKMRAVSGETKVDGIVLSDGTEIQVDGVFFLRRSVAPSTILNGLKMQGAHIEVNRKCETNMPGCFAAGDCTGRPYQIAKAVGEGNVAAHSIIEYLAEVKDENKR